MTAYYNPHTGKLETPEEMGERPADSETVLPVVFELWPKQKAFERLMADHPSRTAFLFPWQNRYVLGADIGYSDFTPSTAPDSPRP